VLHRGAALFQQYIVDMWLSVEMHKLEYYYFNQTKIRADLYDSAQRQLRDGQDVSTTGRRIVLPADFPGCARNMQRSYQDSMAIVRTFGKPGYFITFTANPNWEEIQAELLTDDQGVPMQTWRDRPDLVARVFKLKYDAMMEELKADDILGKYVAHVSVIEYQKRGLPHAHTLLWVKNPPSTPERTDEVIWAEIPDREGPGGQQLYDVVINHMRHRPCGEHNPDSPCMVNGSCKSHYPKPFAESTVLQGDSYPMYRRRADGPRITIKHPNTAETMSVGNEWIVPYNPYLCWRYKSHINVEACQALTSVKYIHKYMHKGPDRATVEFDSGVNEIRQYVSGRYIGSTEAAWRMFGNGVHNHYPSVKPLVVHLPGKHTVTYREQDSATRAAESIQHKQTELMVFFKYNATHPGKPKRLYQDFPRYFTWSKYVHIFSLIIAVR
jgi:Helitron helicase-like domain at N-terminus